MIDGWLARRRVALGVTIALVAIQALLLVRTVLDKSDVWDEPLYLSESGALWTHRSTGTVPLLPKWAIAIAIRVVEPRIAETPAAAHADIEGEAILDLWNLLTPAERRRALIAGRLATVLVTLAAGLAVHALGRRARPSVGVLAHTLWCFSPTVLANGSLATMDMWGAAGIAALAWAVVRVHERASPGRLATFGAIAAAAAATKATVVMALPLAALAVGWTCARRRPEAPRATRARDVATGLAIAAATGFVVLWALYSFHLDRVRYHGEVYESVPFGAWWDNFFAKSSLVKSGQPTYFMGKTLWDGTPWFYLLALAIKTTIGAQLLVLLRLASLRRADLRVDALLLAYPIFLFVVMSRGASQANIMYILPAFPLAIVWLARVVDGAAARFGRAGEGVVLGGLALAAVESVSVHPHHLMFFNRWAGGPSGGHRYLIDREDWGQDKKRLGAWQAAHGVPTVFYRRYGNDEKTWGVEATSVPCRPTVGVYAIHANTLHLKMPVAWGGLRGGCLNWLTVEPPDERLGYSIYVWRVDEARLARLAAKAGTTTPFWTEPVEAPSLFELIP